MQYSGAVSVFLSSTNEIQTFVVIDSGCVAIPSIYDKKTLQYMEETGESNSGLAISHRGEGIAASRLTELCLDPIP